MLGSYSYKILHKLWNSATFTQYGKYFATLGSVIFVLPLVLSSFNSLEISIWLLISTVTSFASILSARLQITFMRVVSFAFAGAKNFTPITNHGKKRGKGKPNWQGIQDIFATLSKTFYYVAFLTALIVVFGLFFSIHNLVDGLSTEHVLIITIVGISTLFTQNFIKYNVFLMGFNEIALINRWNTFFGITGIIGTLIIISLGGGLVVIIAWQMFIPVISAIRDNLLFNSYLRKRDISNNGNFNKEILYAVKEPLWKGLIGHASQMGMVQFSGVIFTIYGNPAAVASYLFSLRILTTIAEFSQVPFRSKQPYYSMLRSEGNIQLLVKVFQNRIAISLATYSVLVIAVFLFNEYLLRLIDTKILFVSNDIWLLMGLLYGIERANVLYFAVLASANKIVMYIEQVLATVCALLLIFITIKNYGLTALILAVWIPRIVMFNIKPLVLAANSLKITAQLMAKKTLASLLFLVVLYFINYTWEIL